MKKNAGRDLMVVSRQAILSADLLQAEVDWLNDILAQYEKPDVVAESVELFDLNKYRIIHKTSKLLRALNEKQPRPFVFIFNKN